MNHFRIRIGRWSYLILSISFALCTLIQIYLAGMAIFIHPSNWIKHSQFGHLFLTIFPILMLIVAIIGSFPRWAYWQTLGLFGMVFLMYFTANISFVIPLASPMHPVFAFFLLFFASSSAIKAWRIIQGETQ